MDDQDDEEVNLIVDDSDDSENEGNNNNNNHPQNTNTTTTIATITQPSPPSRSLRRVIHELKRKREDEENNYNYNYNYTEQPFTSSPLSRGDFSTTTTTTTTQTSFTDEILISSGSEEGEGGLGVEEGTNQICSICLSPIEDLTFAPCYHYFCFFCILQWAEMNPTNVCCPLCKKPFNLLIHSVKTESDYKTFKIDFSNPTTLNNATSSNTRANTTTKPQQQLPSILLRKAVYARGVYAFPLGDRTRLTPDSFNKNALFWESKLTPFIHRELVALLNDNDVEVLVTFVLSLLQKSSLSSPQAQVKLKDFLFENSMLFAHEIECYANSRLNMEAYDKKVKYNYNTAKPSAKKYHFEKYGTESDNDNESEHRSRQGSSDDPIML